MLSFKPCPQEEYAFTDRPEADQYIDQSKSTRQSIILKENINVLKDATKCERNRDVVIKSSGTLKGPANACSNRLLDEKLLTGENGNHDVSKLEAPDCESNQNNLNKSNCKHSKSNRKISVTFCDKQYNTILQEPEADGNPRKKAIRKVGLNGKARHSPNLFQNPYGPPLYNHNRQVANFKISSLVLNMGKQDKNTMDGSLTSSSNESSSLFPKNRSNAQSNQTSIKPPKTFFKHDSDNKISHCTTKEEDKENNINDVANLNSSTKNTKLNPLTQPVIVPFSMKNRKSINNRGRSIEKKVTKSSSYGNYSLLGEMDHHDRCPSKPKTFNSNRSHSTPRKELKRKCNENVNEVNSIYNTNSLSR